MTDASEIFRFLSQEAEEKFGKERAEALRPEIESMAAQLAQLRAVELEFEDEA
jgi:hypothetical protein